LSKMKVFAILALLFCSALALSEVEYQNAFTNWMILNQRSYASNDFFGRYNTFKSNMDAIKSINNENRGFSVAMNKFGDLSGAEFGALYNGLVVPQEYVHVQSFFPELTAPLADSKDWRTEGAVTKVKNQGQCGSCWSFSTTGSVEGCHKITTNTLVSLSEKNLMDCSKAQGNQGCNGGLMTSAMDYIIKNKGIDSEVSYPYQPVDGTCKYNAANKASALASYTNVKSGSEADLLASVNMGPVSVAIDASQSSFQFYSSGVYYDARCSSSNLDHGVLAVGYNTDAGKDYWIVKNSWGTDWGQSGYIWMSRNRRKNWGIATMATLPKTCSN